MRGETSADDFVAYVGGPMHGSGVLEENVHKAVVVAEELRAAGVMVVLPHLSVLWNMIHPHVAEFWLENDFALLRRCDVMLRLPGESPGTDLEAALCNVLGIPVVTEVTNVIDLCHGRHR